ncbi:hypothetical protein GCM10027039_01350 [Terrabacter koreensis]
MPPAPTQPHVLYVAWGFPPARSGGVYRALATANAFARSGFRVTVLTAEREVFEQHTGVDPSMEALVDERVRVLRVPFSWPYPVKDRALWSGPRRLAPRVWWRARVLLDQVPFPEKVYGPWRRRIERAAADLHRREPVDLVVATANPNVAFAVARHLHRRHGVPYVMDYRDAWLLDVFTGRQVHAERSRSALLERSLVRAAREIWFVNEPIRAWHAHRYPDASERMHVVANGADPDFAPLPRTVPSGARPLTFGYIGTVSSKVPVEPFLAGWRLARAEGGALAGARARIHGYLGFHSTPSPELEALVARHADVGVSYEGPLAKGEVRAAYEQFDALLLILGSGAYVTSGKVYEYLSSGLPIVSVHDPGNAASEVLDGYPLWFPVTDLAPESVAFAIRAAAEAARSAPPEVRAACADFGRRHLRDVQLQPRIVALRAGMLDRGEQGRSRYAPD